MINTYIQYCEFSAPSVFQGKRKLLKTPECKKCIQYNELGNSVFSGQARRSKILNGKKYIQYSEKFQGNSVFRASASC